MRRAAAAALVVAALPALCLASRQSAPPAAVVKPRRRRRGLSAVSWLLLSAPTAALPQSFGNLDENGDGLVDMEEFLFLTQETLSTYSDKEFRKSMYEYAMNLYASSDHDGDGFLDSIELAYAEFIATSQSRKQPGAHFSGSFQGRLGMSLKERANANGTIDQMTFDEVARAIIRAWGFDSSMFRTEAVRAGLEEVFGQADIDRDGVLNPHEAEFAAALMCACTAKGFAETIMGDLDHDRDGRIAHEEVEESFRRTKPATGAAKSVTEHMHDLFHIADRDTSGHLEAKEVDIFAEHMLKGTPSH